MDKQLLTEFCDFLNSYAVFKASEFKLFIEDFIEQKDISTLKLYPTAFEVHDEMMQDGIAKFTAIDESGLNVEINVPVSPESLIGIAKMLEKATKMLEDGV